MRRRAGSVRAARRSRWTRVSRCFVATSGGAHARRGRPGRSAAASLTPPDHRDTAPRLSPRMTDLSLGGPRRSLVEADTSDRACARGCRVDTRTQPDSVSLAIAPRGRLPVSATTITALSLPSTPLRSGSWRAPCARSASARLRRGSAPIREEPDPSGYDASRRLPAPRASSWRMTRTDAARRLGARPGCDRRAMGARRRPDRSDVAKDSPVLPLVAGITRRGHLTW